MHLLLAGLQSYGARTLRCVQRYRERAGEKLDYAARRLPTPETLLGPQSQRVDEMGERLKRGLSHVVADARGELARATGALRPAMLTQRLDHAHRVEVLVHLAGEDLARRLVADQPGRGEVVLHHGHPAVVGVLVVLDAGLLDFLELDLLELAGLGVHRRAGEGEVEAALAFGRVAVAGQLQVQLR